MPTPRLLPSLSLALICACSAPASEPVRTERGPARDLWISASTEQGNGDDKFDPAVAGDGAANYLVAYHADTCSDGCDEVHGWLIGTDPSSGEWTELPPAPVVIDGNVRNPSNIGVASSDGTYLVVWEDRLFVPPNSYLGRIFGATVTATAGGAVVSASFLISDEDGDEYGPRVAGMPGGQWLVVWQDTEDPAQGPAIHGRVVSSNGAALGPAGDDVLLSDDGATGAIETEPALGWDGSQFLLSFATTDNEGDIVGALITVGGAVPEPSAGPRFAISQDTVGGAQSGASIACQGAVCLVAWEDSRNAGTIDVFGTRVVAGVPDATDQPLADGAGDQYGARAIASSGGGSFLLLHVDSNNGPSAAWLDGTTIQPIFPSGPLTGATVDAAASSGPGQFLFAAGLFGATASFYDITIAYVLALPNGAACPTSLPADGEPSPGVPADGCLFGVCASGICCNTDCTDACATCDGIGSSTPAGSCGVRTLASNTVCRGGSADGICDPSERCDGTSTLCPADLVRTSTYACRPTPAEPTCDLTETCSGVALEDCPADAFKGSGVSCRAGGDLCNPEETCAGGTADCPADQRLADGDPCDPDALLCNGSPTCSAGACVDLGAPNCDDNDPCTTDSCAEPAGCAHTPIASCVADAGFPDSGPRPDSGSAADAGFVDTGMEPDPDVKDCQCDDVHSTHTSATSLLLLGLGVGLMARRRHR